MNEKIQKKNIIFFSIFMLIVVIVLDLILEPQEIVLKDYMNDLLQTLAAKQNISPQRLYVNAWRTTKNSYFDKTLNNQDWTRWRYRYLKYIKNEEDANVAINTMLSSLNDPYTKFLLSDLFEKQKILMDSKIYGLGMTVVEMGKGVFVREILKNSPAEEANIMPGDAILSVNGVSTKDIDPDELVKIIEKIKTEKVEITFKQNGVVTTKKLQKANIFLPTMEFKITDDNIAIVTLTNIMGEKAVIDFIHILEKTNDTNGIIIDLRYNYGGILSNAIQMANYMLDEDEILSIESRGNKKYQIYSANERIFKKKPIVILINKNTASAAEILAGTLKDNLNAVLIGENSYGKNSIQHVISMSNGTGLILTTDKYIFPSGNDIYRRGLIPDIEIKQKYAVLSNTDKKLKRAVDIDGQLQKGLELIRKVVKNKE